MDETATEAPFIGTDVAINVAGAFLRQRWLRRQDLEHTKVIASSVEFYMTGTVPVYRVTMPSDIKRGCLGGTMKGPSAQVQVHAVTKEILGWQ